MTGFPKTTDLLDADLCVKCGLCLPHCPTYETTLNECESPRGRISLISAIAKQQLPFSKSLFNHLDQCLSCRACESVCPSAVPYGKLLDTTKAKLYAKSPPPWWAQLLFRDLAAKQIMLPYIYSILRFYQTSYLQKFLEKTVFPHIKRLRDLNALLPTPLPYPPLSNQDYYPATITTNKTVALFTGCIAKYVDSATLNASIKILNNLGINVQIPANQGCCGALHLHSGDQRNAQILANQNIEAFSELQVDAILNVVSGCGAAFTDYAHIVAQKQRPQACALAAKVQDISQYIQTLNWPSNVSLAPLDAHVTVHDPCTLRNVLQQANHPYDLLKRIPKLKVTSLRSNHICCGAAGDYMLRHPQLANQLRRKKINHLRALTPDFLVSSNIGCAIHLNAELRELGLSTQVLHPISLVARQLITNNTKDSQH